MVDDLGLFSYLLRSVGIQADCAHRMVLLFRHHLTLMGPEGVAVSRMMLRKMLKNQSGTITAVKVAGELGRRIREMGLVPGTKVTIQGRAPLYDPVALRVMGGTLTLRNNEADLIEVEVEESSE
jgi:ferrous iron transport protein A